MISSSIDFYQTGISSYESPENIERISWFEALTPYCYNNEQSLLDELGINFPLIYRKTMIVFNPLKSFDRQIMDNDDLAGPILFYMLFGLFLLLVSFFLIE
jgi:protein YIPF5/7